MRAAVESLPRTEIMTITADSLAAECSTRWLGLVDDLELELRAHRGEIAVRSASRIGLFDWGVNRRRLRRLRGLFQAYMSERVP